MISYPCMRICGIYCTVPVWRICTLVLCICLGHFGALLGAEPAELVKKLGSAGFEEREQAAAALAALGPAARTAVEAGLKSPDAEIRSRCRQVLVEITEQIYRIELEAIEADPAAKQEFNLPGWKFFKQHIGHDRVAREIFVGMYRAESQLMRSLEDDPQALAERLDQRLYELNVGNTRQLSYQTVTALVFASLQPNIVPSPDALTLMQQYANNNLPLRTAAGSGPKAEPLQKLLTQWIEQTATGAHASSGVSVAMFYKLKGGLKPALEVLAQQANAPLTMCTAALCVARFGDKSHVPALEALLTNEAAYQFAVANQPVAVQVRDAALAGLLHLTGQDLKAYGFEKAEPNATYVYTVSSLYFADSAARDAALKKWNEWKAANPDKLNQDKPDKPNPDKLN